jgi:nitrogenase-associated protein
LATVIFYEKPGCKTNARQRRLLEAAGHNVVAKNLLSEPWTEDRLKGFFAGTPVASWFNPAAPRVKSGEVDPEAIDASGAFALMLSEPLLIRRPLIESGEQRCAGFDREPVTSLLGNSQSEGNLEGCSRPEAAPPCADPTKAREP